MGWGGGNCPTWLDLRKLHHCEQGVLGVCFPRDPKMWTVMVVPVGTVVMFVVEPTLPRITIDSGHYAGWLALVWRCHGEPHPTDGHRLQRPEPSLALSQQTSQFYYKGFDRAAEQRRLALSTAHPCRVAPP
jgi:hypothetical protein